MRKLITFIFVISSIFQLRILPKGRILPIKEGYNEKESNETFLMNLSAIEDRLKNMENQFSRIKRTTFKEVDQITSILTAQAQNDPISSFVRKSIMKKEFNAKIKEALDKREKSRKLDEELKNLNEKRKNVANSNNLLKFENIGTDDLGKIEGKLKELLESGKKVSINLLSKDNTNETGN